MPPVQSSIRACQARAYSCFGGRLGLRVRLVELLLVGDVLLLAGGDPGRVDLLDLLHLLVAAHADLLDERGELDVGRLVLLLPALLGLGDDAGHGLLGLADLVGPPLLELLELALELDLDPVLVLLDLLLGVGQELPERDGMAQDLGPAPSSERPSQAPIVPAMATTPPATPPTVQPRLARMASPYGLSPSSSELVYHC